MGAVIAPCVLAIDPGSEFSAWLVYNCDTGHVRSFAKVANDELLRQLRAGVSADVAAVVVEQIESFGMAVGREVFETVRWAGRFEEAAHPSPVVMLTRRKVKTHLCGSSKAKDANIRQALIDRFGGAGGKATAIGRKASPGPLYGISADVWSALAIAVSYADMGGSR